MIPAFEIAFRCPETNAAHWRGVLVSRFRLAVDAHLIAITGAVAQDRRRLAERSRQTTFLFSALTD